MKVSLKYIYKQFFSQNHWAGFFLGKLERAVNFEPLYVNRVLMIDNSQKNDRVFLRFLFGGF